jgi:hypothetical protein
MSLLSVLDKNGDTKLEWNPKVATEVEVAKEKFDTLVLHKGYAAYELKENDKPGEVIREFNPNAERIFLTPRAVGG